MSVKVNLKELETLVSQFKHPGGAHEGTWRMRNALGQRQLERVLC